MKSSQFKQNSFAPLLRSFNRHETESENWIDHVEIYGIKYIVCDQRTRLYRGLDLTHKHGLWEIHLMQEGEQKYEVKGEIVTLHTDEFLLISPGCSHCQILKESNFSKFNLLIRFPMDFDFFSKKHFEMVQQNGYFISKSDGGMIEILNYLFEYVDQESLDAIFILRSGMELFFRMMSRCLKKQLGMAEIEEGGNIRPEKSSNAEFCERVIAYVKDNISTILTLDDLSTVFFLSGHQINRKLKNYYGKTYYAIADRLRADYARDLLCYSDLSVEEIAYNTGYSNTSNFIRFFKRVEGQSPANFRNAFYEANRGAL